MSDSRFQEKLICRLDEISLNQTKVVLVNDVKICVYRQSSDEILAFGNECSHFGAPLNSGLIHNDYVVCPWHAACFSIRTGDIEEFPGCDNIPVFKTIIKDGKVYVLLSEDNLRKTMTKSLFRRNISKKDVFLIIGGGPASFQCAETLRQEGFIGRIVMVTNEDVSPYDRTKLTKLSTIKIENIVLRNEDYYKRAQIETLYKTTCFKIDFESKIAYFDDCSNLYYDKLFLGTGSRPRKYDEILDGLENVFYIRTYKNSNDVVLLAKDKNIVLIGSSFIVVEMAGVLLKIAKSVKIISRSEVPFAKSLGKQFGTAIKKFLISKNIEFIFITEKLDFTIENRNLTKIKSNNLDFPVDLCVIGIGSLPNSEFLKDTEIKLKNSFVEVDENFQTSVNDVYAGGDLVVFPNKELFGDQLKNIAHWQVAQSHGRAAALHMIGKKIRSLSVPFFWSLFLGKGIKFAGCIDDVENCLVIGDIENLCFAVYYFNDQNYAIGIATMMSEPMAPGFATLLRENIRLTKEDLKNNGNLWFKEHFLNFN